MQTGRTGSFIEIKCDGMDCGQSIRLPLIYPKDLQNTDIRLEEKGWSIFVNQTFCPICKKEK
jgi:hypothetical protein